MLSPVGCSFFRLKRIKLQARALPVQRTRENTSDARAPPTPSGCPGRPAEIYSVVNRRMHALMRPPRLMSVV